MLFVLVSCSQSEAEKKQRIEENYLEKGRVYIQSIIDRGNKTAPVKITSFRNLYVDTVHVMSSQTLEYLKMTPLIRELNEAREWFDKMNDIDMQFGTSPSSQTINARNKTQFLLDSSYRWGERIQLLDSLDTVGYQVMFGYDISLSDGTEKKDRGMSIYFDAEHDIQGDWNEIK